MGQLSLLGAGGSGGGGSTVLLLDHFTDADGTALTAHTMDVGPGWTTSGGTWSIESDQVEKQDTGINSAFSDSGAADVTIQTVLNLTNIGAGVTGIAARWQDANNLFILGVIGSNAFALYERSGGSFTLRASATVTISTGVNYTLQLVTSGTSLVGTLNGANTLTYTSSDFQTATNHGLYSDTTTNPFWDNFQVTHP